MSVCAPNSYLCGDGRLDFERTTRGGEALLSTSCGHDTTSNLSNHVYGIRGGIHRKLSIGDGKLGEDVFGVNLVALNSIVRLSVDLKPTTVCAPSWVN
jgi:hypothetical protein